MRIYFKDGTYQDKCASEMQTNAEWFESILEATLGQDMLAMYYDIVNDILYEHGEELSNTLDTVAYIMQESKKMLNAFQTAKSISRKEVTSALEKIQDESGYLYDDIQFRVKQLQTEVK